MIVLDPHYQLAFTQFGLEALARSGLCGVTDGLAAFVEEDAVAAAEGRQRADDMQVLHQVFEFLPALAQLAEGGARQALGQAVQALAQQNQAASRMLGGQASVQARQAFAATVQLLLECPTQAHIQVADAPGWHATHHELHKFDRFPPMPA